MKKAIFMAIVSLALVFTACKDKTVSTQYTIGCLGYQSGMMEDTEWEALENYFSTHVDYNKHVVFEGKSLAENDAQAKALYESQAEKLDKEYVCSLIGGGDYFIYGIATVNADGGYRIIKAMRFQESGTMEVED